MDYAEILTSIGYELQDLGKELRGVPVYRDSQNPSSLKIDKETGHFIDFSANISGSFEELIKLSLGFKTIKDVENWLETEYDYNKNQIVHRPKLRTVKKFSKSLLTQILPRHEYWINRGISEEVLREFKGGVMFNTKMHNRYCWPIFDENENIVGLSGRDLSNSDNRPKYKHLGFKSSWNWPLFLNKDIINDKKEIILVESPGDCLSLFECGIRNVIVTFGVQLSKAIIGLLLKLDLDRIIISFNNDKENNNVGNLAAQKCAEKLWNFFDREQITVSLPPEKDWNNCLMKDRKIIENWHKNLHKTGLEPENIIKIWQIG